jgi:KaiC/GvpD/RAD55 family RecA-like ATPase
MRRDPIQTAIPDELKALPQWVVWRGEKKLPYCPVIGTLASSTDPKTWGTFAEAMERYGRGGFDGIGFCFTPDDPYCGIDLDDCLDEQQVPYARAWKLIERFGSYAEISPSGRGVKIIVRAKKPGEKCKKPGFEWADGATGQIEMYDTGRYFTVTGNLLPDAGYEIQDRQAAVSALYRQLWGDKPTVKAAQPTSGDVVERCWKYLLKCPDSISGQNGHDKALRAACECMRFGLSDGEAANLMQRWSAEKSDEPWSDREIAHKLRDARAKCVAEGSIGIRLRDENWKEPAPLQIVTPPTDQAPLDRIDRIIRGEFAPAPWKWDILTQLTQSLVPGSVTLLCGEPGAGKTFFLMDAMLGWLELGVSFAAFELEEDREYYKQRALAILEGNASLTDLAWIRNNAKLATEARDRNAHILKALGERIWDSPRQRVSLPQLAKWYEEAAKTARVVVIDPVTAASVPEKRWLADGDFIERVKTIALDTGTSLVLVTHPKIGKRVGAPTLDDMAGGADYPRFTQTVLVIGKRKNTADPVRVVKRSAFGTESKDVMANRVLHLRKTRNGRGDGLDIAFNFDKLQWTEMGVIAG